MDNTPKRRRKNKKLDIKYAVTNFIVVVFFLQLSMTVIFNITEFISSNIKYYELTKYMESVTLLNDEFCD